MEWKLMQDPENVENRNAGNGGDLVKHTVYLATLRFLIAQELWKNGVVLRECHAGRGIYRIPDGSVQVLSRLYSSPTVSNSVLLQSAQRNALGKLGCWPNRQEAVQWYAGSALLNALALANQSSHRMEFYEWLPETRQVLRAVLNTALPDAGAQLSVVSEDDRCHHFDGEAYIEQGISGWGKQNVILLDPFAMWRQAADQRKRDRYSAIIDGLVSRGNDAPSLILFWTWGRAFPIADGDLDGTAKPVTNGYADLRIKLRSTGFHFVLVKWRWGLQFAMWVVVPGELLEGLKTGIDSHCRLLSEHLLKKGYGPGLRHPSIEVAID